MDTDGDYVPLCSAAERVYRDLSRDRGTPGPALLEAASAAISVFAATLVRNGEPVVRRQDLEAALQRLRSAGVCFSEVRQW